MVVDPQRHWEGVYAAKAEREVSWFQEEPATSMDFIRRCGLGRDEPIIDVGGGASRLVDHLVDAGHSDVAVLDVSARAIARARERLSARGAVVHWLVADITRWTPDRHYRLWHDRAVSHFLTDPADRAAYRQALLAAIPPGGWVVIATFALDGPEKCSGLPVVRHSADTLAAELGPDFTLVDSMRDDHRTPWGAVQRFQWSRFARRRQIAGDTP